MTGGEKMKIYLDGLFYKGSGIGKYYEFLIKELAKREKILRVNEVYDL